MKIKRAAAQSAAQVDDGRKITVKLICAIIATGMLSFTGIATETAMNLAFPKVMAEFGVTTDEVQWLTTGCLLLLALTIPLSSYLKKRFSNKSLFVAAAIIFTAGTLLAMLGDSFACLLAGRLIQGLGSGVSLPLMFNIILEQVPINRIGSMVGMACLVVAVAPAIGPFAGGFITTYWGWRMIFAVLLPLLLLTFALGVCCIKQVTPLVKTPFKWLDYAFIVVGFTAFVLGTSLSAKRGWLDAVTLGLLTVAALALLVFYRRARGQKDALIDVGVFQNVKFSLSLLSIIILQFVVLGLSFLLPNYVQLSLHENPFNAGMVLIPGCLAGFIVTPIGGRLLDKFGAARPIIAGNALALAGVVGMGVCLRAGAGILAAAYVVFACGQALMTGNTFTNAMAQLDENLKNSGNAVFNTFQQLAGAAGTSVTAAIVAAQQAGGADLAATTAVGTLYALILLTVMVVVILFCSCKIFSLRARLAHSKKFCFSFIIFLQALLLLTVKIFMVAMAYVDLLHLGQA